MGTFLKKDDIKYLLDRRMKKIEEEKPQINDIDKLLLDYLKEYIDLDDDDVDAKNVIVQEIRDKCNIPVNTLIILMPITDKGVNIYIKDDNGVSELLFVTSYP